MKKKFFIFTLILLLVLSLCMPVMAATEYGVIYDQTDELPPWPLVGVAVGISCLIAGGICFLLLRSMKSVHQKKEADVYLTEGGLHLTQQYDQYTHTTETRRKIEKSSISNSES